MIGTDFTIRPLRLNFRVEPKVASITLPSTTLKEKGPIGVEMTLVTSVIVR